MLVINNNNYSDFQKSIVFLKIAVISLPKFPIQPHKDKYPFDFSKLIVIGFPHG
jgi:hypothetical protein